MEEEEEEKSSNLNHNPQKLDSNTEMKTSIKKKKTKESPSEERMQYNSTYYGPTSHKEEISSSYSSNKGLMSNSGNVEIVAKPSTWKEKKTEKKLV
eukprot:388134-Ditylum_brightwellii.AAC.1